MYQLLVCRRLVIGHSRLTTHGLDVAQHDQPRPRAVLALAVGLDTASVPLHASETMRKSYQHLTARKCAPSLTCQLVAVSYLAHVNRENETRAGFVNDCAYLALTILEPACAWSAHSPGDERRRGWRGSCMASKACANVLV